MAEELSKKGKNNMLATVTAPIHKPVLSPGQPLIIKSEESDEDSCSSSSQSSSISGADSGSMGVAHTENPCVKLKLPHQLIGDSKHINNNILSGIANDVSATNLQSPLINTPLNLSISANGPSPAETNQTTPQLLATPQPAAMPQFILASGQLIQGIQGAQLLIPTAQGIATQTILTIPVNHVTSNQVVNLALSNGQVITTTLANLQSMAQPHHLISPQTNGVSPSPPSVVPPPAAHPLPNYHQTSHNGIIPNTNPPIVRNPPQNPFMAKAEKISPNLNNNNNNNINSNINNNLTGSHPLNSSSGTVTSSSSPVNRLSSKNADLAAVSTATTTTTSASASSVTANQYNGASSPTHDLFGESNQPTISQSTANTVDGINLDEIKEFAKAFKLRRLSLGLTQTQVGQALSVTEGPAYSQSAICSALATQMYCAAQLASQQQSMFEKLDITPKSAEKIKPVLERWLKEAEERHRSGQNHLTEFIGMEPSKKRKRRTSFTPQALELLNAHFELNTHPSGTDITALAHQLGYEREVIRIWFCNKRQALKNTVRMMSKGCT